MGAGFPFWVHLEARATAKSFIPSRHEAYPIYYNKDVRLVCAMTFVRPQGDGTKWIGQLTANLAKRAADEPLANKGPKIHKEGRGRFR